MTPPIVKRLVVYAILGTSASLLLMLAGIVFPHPFLLVLVMSVGQGVGLLALALFLLAVTLDIQSAITGTHTYLPDDEPQAPASGDPAPPGLNPSP